MEGPGMVFMVIWNILWSFAIFYGHLVLLYVVIWYIFPRFGILCQEKIWQPCSEYLF
jgi:hypothetical protein